MQKYIYLILLAFLGCRSTGTPAYHDIGPIQRPVTTSSAKAQMWFDRGLGLAYGFNHSSRTSPRWLLWPLRVRVPVPVRSSAS